MDDKKLFDAIEHGKGGDRELGVVTLAPDGTMAIVSEAGDGDGGLRTVVDELNRETQLHAPAVPPPGAKRFEVFTQPVTRDQAAFVPTMLAFLRKYHDIELRAR